VNQTIVESDSFVTDKKSKVTVQRESASSASDESVSDTASGDCKEITDGDDRDTQLKVQ
jgi:hypothetical protein